VIILSLDDVLHPDTEFRAAAHEFVAAELARSVPVSTASLLRSLKIASINSCGDHRWALAELAREHGFSASLYARSLEIYSEFRPGSMALHPDACDFLDRAEGNVDLALITDGDPKVERRKIRQLGLAHRIDFLIITSDHGDAWRRPASLSYSAVLQRYQVRPNEVLAVAAHPATEIEGARRVGIPVVRLLRGEHACDPLCSRLQPTPTLKDLRGLGQEWGRELHRC